MKIRILFAVGLFWMGLLPGCSKTDPTVPLSETQALAEVNGHVITVGDFSKQWFELPEVIRRMYTKEDGKKDFLNELITRELLLQEARQRKLDRDPALNSQVEAFRERLLLEAMLKQEVENKIVVSDEELSSYFEAHKTSLAPIEEVRVQHILVKTEAQARNLLAKLAQGVSFARLAKTDSQDPGTKNKGGDLGMIRKGQTMPEFEAAAFRLKPGQTSDVVKTPSGYHIIRVQSRRTVRSPNLQDARDEVHRAIIKEKERKYFDELIGSLRAKAAIQVMDPVLASLHIPGNDPSSTHER